MGVREFNPNHTPYCENKYLSILKSFNINDDNSSLSDIEDEILKTCQRGGQSEREDLFVVKKEPRKVLEKSVKILDKNMNKKPEDIIKFDRQVPDSIKTMQDFENFAEAVGDSVMYQPLKNINFTSGFETWHNSRKCSENFISWDCNSKNKSSEKEILKEITTKAVSIITSTPERQELNREDKFIFKVPRSHKLDPLCELSSNLNLYNKPFVPKSKTKEKLKNLVPFLKEFKPRFLKKENIDKKILRKFRNYVKLLYKEDRSILDSYDRSFWKGFITSNLLPPMKYEDDLNKVQFKSFNTKYLLWLFSKEGCVNLFRKFAGHFKDQILGDFIASYDLTNNIDEKGIIEQLKYYIVAIPDIYNRRSIKINNYGYSNTSNMSYTHSEELLADYIGCEFNASKPNSFILNNFGEAGYPRCGRKITDLNDREYYEDYEDYEGYMHVVDSVMNASFDSVASN